MLTNITLLFKFSLKRNCCPKLKSTSSLWQPKIIIKREYVSFLFFNRIGTTQIYKSRDNKESMGSWTELGSLQEELPQLKKKLLSLEIQASRRWTADPKLVVDIASTKKRILQIEARLKQVNKG